MLQLFVKLNQNPCSPVNEVWLYSNIGYHFRIKGILSSISRAKGMLQMHFGVAGRGILSTRPITDTLLNVKELHCGLGPCPEEV